MLNICFPYKPFDIGFIEKSRTWDTYMAVIKNCPQDI